MGAVIGDLIPLAVGIAISPVPVMAVILMLFAPRVGRTSAGFLLGWVAGIVVAVAVFLLVSGAVDLGGSDQPSTGASWVKLVLGIALLVLAVREWRQRPKAGQSAPLPGWMSAIDKLTPVRATGLGFLLAAVNPKNLAMSIAAGVAIAGGNLSGAQATVTVVVGLL